MGFFFHRDGFVHQLNRVHVYLKCLQNERTTLQVLTGKRLVLLQQAAYIAEAEAAGSSLSNHALNTLTQRYGSYKRTKNEYNNSKEALVTMRENCMQQMTEYRSCLKEIESNQITEQSSHINELLSSFQIIITPHAFGMVKDFLDNSAQMAIYIQSCQLSGCLDDVLLKQITAVQQALDAIVDYGAVSRYHPPSTLDQHRLSKWCEWCQHLIDNATVQECQDVIAQCQRMFGKTPMNNVIIQQVMTFSYQMQSNICDSEIRVQKSLERLQSETDEPTNSDLTGSRIINKYATAFEDARKSIRLFLHEPLNKKQSNVFALHCVSTTTLCDLNKRLLMMENAAANAGENMVDLTFNGNWVLDELYAHTAIMCEITFIVESAHRELATNLLSKEFLYAEQCLRQIQQIHGNVRIANEQFSSVILMDALHGVISENKGVLDIVTALSNLQESLQTIPELLANLNTHLRRSAMLGCVEDSTASADVCILRQKFGILKQQSELNSASDAGAKLFLTMNGQFERLDDEYDRLMQHVELLSLREELRKVDQMKAALELTVRNCKNSSFSLSKKGDNLHFIQKMFFFSNFHFTKTNIVKNFY